VEDGVEGGHAVGEGGMDLLVLGVAAVIHPLDGDAGGGEALGGEVVAGGGAGKCTPEGNGEVSVRP
jgi:hypothetical protein